MPKGLRKFRFSFEKTGLTRFWGLSLFQSFCKSLGLRHFLPGSGGLPANTAGRALCLLSGGFDSAVAAWKMMKRGAHLSFAHFYGGGGRPGESSMHVARELVRNLVPWQFTATLYLVPFEPIQREIVARAPEPHRILLYRRMMLRIAERLALRERARALRAGTVEKVEKATTTSTSPLATRH